MIFKKIFYVGESMQGPSGIKYENAPSDPFLGKLVRKHRGEKSLWSNNNGTLSQYAWIVDLKDADNAQKIIQKLFEHNQKGNSLVAVPVAGWDVKSAPWYFSLITCCSTLSREHRLTREYAKSCSLSPFSTGENADIILRVGEKGQKMKVFEKAGQMLFKASAGVRITDAENYLLKKGLTFRPNVPTLHVASLVGAAANGSYGPGRDYGPLSTNIVEMKVITAAGKKMTLSSEQNAKLFNIFRDFHMGAGFFVKEITIGNIEPKFRMKRKNVLYLNAKKFERGMKKKGWMNKEHFIGMYLPVDIDKTDNHFPRIRVTTFERTDKEPSEETKYREERDFCDYINQIKTCAGEPLIDLISRSPRLHKYLPRILKFAAMKTYCFENKTTEIDWSHKIAHILRTCTDLPIHDINWLIQVDSPKQARILNVKLIKLTESYLKEEAKSDEHPILNAFSRYLKGVYYPKGKGGPVPTATDHPGSSIFSFEYITYCALAETDSFKNLVDKVINYLKKHHFTFTYHPGKHWPDGVDSLTQIYPDQARLKNFRKAVCQLHGGKDNIEFSPLLTPQKKRFIGLGPGSGRDADKKTTPNCTRQEEDRALKRIKELAEEIEGIDA
jgi:hypothetical protein